MNNYSNRYKKKLLRFIRATGLGRYELEHLVGTQLKFNAVSPMTLSQTSLGRILHNECGISEPETWDKYSFIPKELYLLVVGENNPIRAVPVFEDCEFVQKLCWRAEKNRVFAYIPANLDFLRAKRTYAQKLYWYIHQYKNYYFEPDNGYCDLDQKIESYCRDYCEEEDVVNEDPLPKWLESEAAFVMDIKTKSDNEYKATERLTRMLVNEALGYPMLYVRGKGICRTEN